MGDYSIENTANAIECGPVGFYAIEILHADGIDNAERLSDMLLIADTRIR